MSGGGFVIFYVFHVCYGYRQLIVKGITRAAQSSTFDNLGPYNAIDGYPSRLSMSSGSCSHTGIRQSVAWLQLDLRKEYNIKYIKFWYRNDRLDELQNTIRLHGYFLQYYGKNNRWEECYHDTSPINQTIPMPSIVECPQKTRYIKFYKNTPSPEDGLEVYLEMCEIEVYGCDVNQYGENCTECVSRCVNCDIVDGCVRCQSGFAGKRCEDCEPGFSGQNCECQQGRYGFQCNNSCTTCKDMTCNHVNGSCSLGCIDGWTGALCAEVCPGGFFGPNCSSRCGNCENETCHHVNGMCPGNCKEGWKGEKCLQVSALITDEDTPGTPLSMPVVAGAALGVMVALILIIIVIVIRVRRRHKPLTKPESKWHQKLEDQTNMDPLDNKTSPTGMNGQIDGADESTYYNIETTETTRKTHVDTSINIPIANLANVIALKMKKECSDFKKEYGDIPYGEETHIPCTVGKLPENKAKNRFKTTFPYDHSRIVLENTESDYINANYIKNMKEERVYIASQGPKPNTMADHWKMVWQEKVSVIVMLTNLIEGMKKKCEKYWPDLDIEMMSGKFKLQLLQEKTYAYYVVRRIKVTNLELKSPTSVIVTQFHYTQWPDHGVPDPLSLAIFQKHVRRIQNEHKNNPLLVHCSAGIGRTGTFIALDALYQHGLETGSVNVQGYVKKMREDRMSMVQNCEQYIELYNALLESFKGESYVISKDAFLNDIRKISNATESNPSWIQSQFEKLQTIKKSYTDDNKKEGSRHKELNMTRNIMPVDKYRAILTSNISGRSNYYNAVFLSTFTDKDVLIAGQYPLSGNSIDLVRLLLDHESSILVYVNRLSDVPSSDEWFPDKKKNLHPYELIKEKTSSVSQTIRKHDLKIRHLDDNALHPISLFEILSWTIKDTLPTDANTMTDVIRNVQMEVASQSTKTPITILSKDGATGCGVFCCIYNAVQQLQQDDEVDLFTIVRQLQIRRPEMISTVEEYHYCFRDVSNILTENSSEVYNNTECVYANT
ncbi:receptor-type tyrosine-protein phosphatase epsilon-like isoform X15 [Saccostrea cucullata]|uniref:receptor-type tyrosine-protein phosphatase epsilon-like isoform X15 n=1 Tax=Saccostrea cuccullata TaxID=36930 RepID=UPI002ED524F2